MFYNYLLAIVATILVSGPAVAADAPLNISSREDIWGAQTNGLQPGFFVEKTGTNWYIEIEYLAQSNFLRNSWLKPTNRLGSRLQLWLTNGVEVISTNASTAATTNLPSRIAVSNILDNVPWRRRSMQWWRTGGSGSTAGESAPATTFDLCSAFDMPFTNDIVLQITPLLYKADPNGITADLVEFPPTKLKLKSDGKVEEIK